MRSNTRFVIVVAFLFLTEVVSAFLASPQQLQLGPRSRWLSQRDSNGHRSHLCMAQVVGQQEAQKGIDKAVAALRNDKRANSELGRLEKVTTVLGFGSPSQGTLAVRFNAVFKRGGMGLSSVPLPFGLGQSNVSEGRGTMVGQVKASISMDTGKVTSCSVFRDLGYGRSFELKV